ncbi:hypothetical protein GCM10009559_42830 [Pseudonocardia zijingensis]|uniref:Uncharacterized protein n=1 Tax=Pseudonocardia zijingensis TaxID=153376 RepID=A0ABN1QMY3_9PSEU
MVSPVVLRFASPDAVAWTPAWQPSAPAMQVAVSRAWPGACAVSVSRQSGPAHSPEDEEIDQSAGAFFTGLLVLRCSLMTSATTWPVPAAELPVTRHASAEETQVAEVRDLAGGPRELPAPFPSRGVWLPQAACVARPVQRMPAAQSRVASAIAQLDAPDTVGAPPLADEPGAVGAIGVALCEPGSVGTCVVPSATVAFAVDVPVMIGAISLAFGAVEEPELITALQVPPETRSHPPTA